MFVSDHDPNLKGNVAEAAILSAAVKAGINVLRPQFEHGRYDLAFDLADRIVRVQCKWARRLGDVVIVNLAASRRTSTGAEIRKTYSSTEIDAVVAYCADLDACYLLPIEKVAGMRAFQLRLAPPANGQRASINWADEYRFPGAVAQLEVAPRWQRGGRGFESHQLHSRDTGADVVTLGAYEYRQKFGWYMERAAAGETFLITRRGKPYARLMPAETQLPVTADEPDHAEVIPITRTRPPDAETG